MGFGPFSSAKSGQVSLREPEGTHFKYPGNYSGVFSCLTSSLAVQKILKCSKLLLLAFTVPGSAAASRGPRLQYMFSTNRMKDELKSYLFR